MSDHEDSYASHGFEKMVKLSISNMPKQCMDDSEVCTPASSNRIKGLSSPCKVRKALKMNLLKKTQQQQQEHHLH